MSRQSKEAIKIGKRELEWLYVPDVEYGECGGVKRYLQLIIPYKREWKEKEKYPLIVFIPGSAWHRQEMYNSLPAYAELAKRGFAMAMVQFRESELATFPAQVLDIKKAIRFIFTIAEQFHIDAENIFIAGDSSGGHLALLTGLTAESGELDEDFEKGMPLHIKGIVDYFGPTDLFLSKGFGPTEALLGTDNVNHVPELTKSASCQTYISAERKIPPILMFHGLEDELVSIEHSRSLFEKLKASGKAVQYYEIEKEGHGGGAYWGKEVLDIVEKFLGEM